MSKKNKNKNTNNFSNNNKPQLAQSSNELSAEQQQRIDNLELNVAVEVESNQVVLEELDEQKTAEIAELKTPGDIDKYRKKLEDIYTKLVALQKTFGEKDQKFTEEKEKIKKEQETLNKEKSSLSEKWGKLNAKEKEVQERELQIDNGEFTGTIRSLLDALNNSEKEIASETKKIIDDLSQKHKQLLAKQKEVEEKKIDLEADREKLDAEKQKLEAEQRKLKKDQDNLKEDRELLREEVQEELEDKYSDVLSKEKDRADRFKKRNEKVEAENGELKDDCQKLFLAFGKKEPKDILKELNDLRGKCDNLKEELDNRPTQEELEGKRKQIDCLKSQVEEYKNKINEKELLQLKAISAQSDYYVLEIQRQKDELEVKDNFINNLQKTKEALMTTIHLLNGEDQKKEDAFQYAKKYDQNEALNRPASKLAEPESLFGFANYIQQKMAFSDKPFYYDLDTLRIFIAGLNMSNISILQGISGTGKTSLPREFAKAILSDKAYQGQGDDNSPNAPYRICAVQSGWRDKMDLMGYYNSFEHKYKETEFFKALYLANLPKYSDTLFFIILDEMNLSRPEHYFADFLSLLEQSEDDRYISVDAPDEFLPKLIVEGKLKVPANVRFIGTANHDETTLEFAPKTYDRSNLIEMPKNEGRKISNPNREYNVNYEWLSKKFKEATDKHKEDYDNFKEFISAEETKDLLNGMGIGVGNRFEDQAERFIGAFIELGTETKAESLAKAADHLITTRLLRTLKNRFDIEKTKLEEFKQKYDKIFEEKFLAKPTFADALLKTEIDKK